MSDSRRNIELKARDADPQRSLEICESLGAEKGGVLVQRDTYFQAPNGRLKLREETGAAPQLIFYSRPDRLDSRESRYRIVELESAEELIAVLTSAIGVKATVAKERRLFLWQGVRIHLDEVESLGSFIEFEAVAPPDSDLSGETRQVELLREAFALDAEDLLATSYCDLVAG